MASHSGPRAGETQHGALKGEGRGQLVVCRGGTSSPEQGGSERNEQRGRRPLTTHTEQGVGEGLLQD